MKKFEAKIAQIMVDAIDQFDEWFDKLVDSLKEVWHGNKA